MNRRRFLSLSGQMGLAAAAARLGAAAPIGPGPVNVLLIMVDDYAAEWSDLFPASQVKTPNLRRLASRGTWFRNAHCPAPACCPSRTSLLTGLEPHTSGVYLNNQPYRRSPTWIRAIENLPGYFKSHGYTSAGYGKIFHHTGGMQEHDAEAWSAGHFFPLREEEDLALGDRALQRTVVPGISNVYSWGALPDDYDRDDPDRQQQDTRNANRAIALLRQAQTQPFFCGMGFFRPHLRWYAPKRFFDLYPLDSIQAPAGYRWDDLDDIPAGGRALRRPNVFEAIVGHGHWKAALQAYMACISYMDEQLGRVLDALEAGPHAHNTVVMFAGDNGWLNGEKNHFSKYVLWEKATRVPLIVSVPGLRPSACDSPVSLVDLYPTLLQQCRLPAPRHNLDGVSLTPLLANPGADRGRPVLTTQGFRNHALRSREYRYIRYRDGSEELYDHRRDPGEWKNLAGDASFSSAKAELARYLPATDAEPIPSEGSAVGG